MTGFLSRLFGGKKKDEELGPFVDLIGETLAGVLERASLDLSFEVKDKEDGVVIELSGNDAELLREREGQLLDALQFLIKRVVQHKFPELKLDILCDCNGYREESSQALIELAERLKKIVIEKNRSVFVRALPPKDRKIVHQYLANDGRVKSKSIGEGLYKKIKIFPASDEGGGSGRGGRRRNNSGPRSETRGETRNENEKNDHGGNYNEKDQHEDSAGLRE